jgi:hypothetical protein
LAIAGSNPTNGLFNTVSTASSYTTASITPTAGDLMLVAVNTRKGSTPEVPTLTGTNGLNVTWTLINSGLTSGSVLQRIALFRGIPSSNTAGMFTADYGGVNQSQCNILVVSFSGVDTATNQGVVQDANNTASSGTCTVTLAAFGDAANATYINAGARGGPTGITVEDGTWTGYTTGDGVSTLGSGVAWKAGNDTTPSITLTSGLNWYAIAVELKAASSSGTTSITPGVDAVVLGGVAAVLLATTLLAAAPKALALTGAAPTATIGGSGDVSKQPSPKALALTGQAPTLTLSGGDVFLTPGPRALAVVGTAPISVAGLSVSPGAGALLWTGRTPQVLAPIRPPAGALTLTETVPRVTRSDQIFFSAFASYDLDTLAVPYDGRLVGPPTIVRRVVETQWGEIEVQDVSLELACVPGEPFDPTSDRLLAAYLADPKRFRSRSLVIKRHDLGSGTTLTEWTGTIARCTRSRTTLSIHGSNFNRAILDRPVPEPTVDTTEFPNAIDVGETIPVPFGVVPKTPLLYVNDDVIGSRFDRLVGWGVGTVTAAWRNGPNETLYPIGVTEFEKLGGGAATTWGEVARYDLYPGYTAVRTLLRQTDFNNAHHVLTADVVFPDRSFVRIARRILTDPSWGLGATVDGPSWEAAEIALAQLAPDAGQQALALGPLLYWDLRDTGATVTDTSGNGRHGVLNGPVVTNQPGAPFGGVNQGAAMTFPGTLAAYLSRAPDAALNSGTAGTVSVWVKVTTLHPPMPAGGGIVEKTIGGVVNTQWVLYHVPNEGYPTTGNPPGIRFRIIKGGVNYDAACPLTAADVGQWHHIVGTYNTNTVRIYKNGALVGVATYPAGAIDTGAGDLLVGKLGSGVFPLSGSLDELAIYNSELSAAQVATLYQAGGLLADGTMRETKSARQWLRECLMVRSLRLGINALGAWTIAVDTQQNAIRLRAADDGRNTLLEIHERTPLAPEDLCRKRVLKYRENYVPTNTDKRLFLFRARRIVNASEGTNRTEALSFVRDHTTADMIADYLAHLDQDAEESVEVELPQEARALAEGELVELTDAGLGYAGEVLTTVAVGKGLTRITATLHPRDWGRDFYTPAGTSPDNTTGTATDFTRAAPGAPTTPTLSATGTRVAGDGHISAYVTLAWTNPTDGNLSFTRVRYRVTGLLPWMEATQNTTAGATTATIEGLLPNTAYDYSLQAVNLPGNLTTDSGILANQTTPNTGAPPAPTNAPTVVNYGPGTFQIFDFNVRPIWVTECVFYINSANNSATATVLTTGRERMILDQSAGYGAQRWYWLKYQDGAGNLSGFSPPGTSGAAGARPTQGGDIDSGAVNTGHITPLAITEADADGSSSYTNSAAVEEVMLSINVPGSGGYVVIYGKSSGSTILKDEHYVYRLRKGSTVAGTQIDTGSLVLDTTGTALPTGVFTVATCALMAVDNSPGTNQAYVLTFEFFKLGHAIGSSYNNTLTAQRFKR